MKHCNSVFTVMILCIGILLPKPGNCDDPVLSEPSKRTELQGLVIDKTLTPPGRQFYRVFARIWWELNKQTQGNLVVIENPDALRGSQVIISMNRKALFITGLSPARTDIEKKAMAAVDTVERRVSAMSGAAAFSYSEDLAGDEF